ncbi:cyanidin 3-O-galactoside 2''-O-xylosyltransferase FGGT1 [Ricinus communis]|uniref:Glycosyltransferase n=1 Tax=Ricinus communis TaxID=3988 RepID=B9S939_RICCO|nr:cyanidin 3-O-galactoside 2''-O-xylosyltransferase FGGT1 [Ricinus communis]EEF39808.1 UDP-glucosyltransferase, putative [Ricinus communis]|eukprot:XP_002522508.1 UDP-glycosyltransferase 79B30 [Ricinus communis]
MGEETFHIVMYPWFALGHLTSFLHLSNKLAERGHKISFLLPSKTIKKFQPFNLHPDLIIFIPVTVPHVDGLPPGSETTTDVPFSLHSLLMTAMDLTESVIEFHLTNLKPNFVFFDFTHWLPALCRKLGVKSVHYCTISPATVGYLISPERKLLEKSLTAADLMKPPLNFPPSSIKLRAHEAQGLAAVTTKPYGSSISFLERQLHSFNECDAISFKTCMEMEGPYCHYVERQFGKPVILAGPVVPKSPSSVLDEKISNMLDNSEAGKVVFCAFGSECILKKNQLQELVLGLELTGLPFLAALKPPMGAETIESALPEGFEERVKGKGYVYGGWVQQQLILKHPSVGCFITHCGSGSLSEAMVNKCQLVLLPNVGDQIINARLMDGDLKIGVEVEKGEEDGLFTKDGVRKAVKAVMDDDSEVGKEVRTNHMKWREFLLSKGLENSYIDAFVNKLHALLG